MHGCVYLFSDVCIKYQTLWNELADSCKVSGSASSRVGADSHVGKLDHDSIVAGVDVTASRICHADCTSQGFLSRKAAVPGLGEPEG